MPPSCIKYFARGRHVNWVKSLQKIIEKGMEGWGGLHGLSCPPSPSGHIYFFWTDVAKPGELPGKLCDSKTN